MMCQSSMNPILSVSASGSHSLIWPSVSSLGVGDSLPLFSCGGDVFYPLIMLTPSCKCNTKLVTLTVVSLKSKA